MKSKNWQIGLKRFFQNKNTVTIIGIILCLFIIYFAYNQRVSSAIKPVKVPYAKVTIQPRTEITSDMIGYMEVPTSYLKGNYISNASFIIGKYSNYNTIIPSGSLFYKDALINVSELPDSAFGNIPSGYTVFNLPVTMNSTYGNSIFPGNYINIYFKAIDDDGKILFGKLIRNIEILDVKDSSGRHVFENTDESRVPSSLIFAVPEEIHLLLRKALYLTSVSAELIPVPNTEVLTEEDVVEVSSEHIKEFILSKTTLITEDMLPNVSE